MRLLLIGDFFPPNRALANAIVTLLVCTALAFVPICLVYNRLYGDSAVVFVTVYQLSIQALNLAIGFAMEAYQKHIDYHVPLLTRVGTDAGFVFPHHLFGATLFGMLVAWLVLRVRLGPVVLQDGSLCPACGYSLRGCVVQRCPECGREFTFQELGVTAEQFYANWTPVARPLPMERQETAIQADEKT
jgi:hypothetical protein